MKKIILSLILLSFLSISFVSSLPVDPPHAFRGEVRYNDGELFENGILFAEIDGIILETGEITNGIYGFWESFIVKSGTGGIIYFYVDSFSDSVGEFIFSALEVTELNLVINESSPEEPIPAQKETRTRKSTFSPNFCYTNWECGSWSECNNGIKTRTCSDKNHCETPYNKPFESTGCQVIEESKVQEDQGKTINLNPFFLFFTIFLAIELAVLIFLTIQVKE